MTEQTKPILRVIVASTRPSRVGGAVGTWIADRATADGRFDVRVSDLLEMNLPLMDEPNHPNLQQYTKEYTKTWSAEVAGSDAFILVMPEYNHSYTAPLKNALDYLSKEWGYKPVGLVSYGGISGGLRAVQAIKPVLTALRMTPLNEAVVIQGVGKMIDDDASFQPAEHVEHSVQPMLDEIAREIPVLAQLKR